MKKKEIKMFEASTFTSKALCSTTIVT